MIALRVAALALLLGIPAASAANEQIWALLKSALAGKWRGKGNLVLVSHGSTISALTGVSLDTAEIVVVTPQGEGRFAVAGRLTAHSP